MKWMLGIFVGASWAFLNGFFLFQLLKTSVDPTGKKKDKILLFSILKFPVLYVAGFFILSARFFPVESLLLGVALPLAALGVFWLKANFYGVRTSRGC